jgi:hypothetical protein
MTTTETFHLAKQEYVRMPGEVLDDVDATGNIEVKIKDR